MIQDLFLQTERVLDSNSFLISKIFFPGSWWKNCALQWIGQYLYGIVSWSLIWTVDPLILAVFLCFDKRLTCLLLWYTHWGYSIWINFSAKVLVSIRQLVHRLLYLPLCPNAFYLWLPNLCLTIYVQCANGYKHERLRFTGPLIKRNNDNPTRLLLRNYSVWAVGRSLASV